MFSTLVQQLASGGTQEQMDPDTHPRTDCPQSSRPPPPYPAPTSQASQDSGVRRRLRPNHLNRKFAHLDIYSREALVLTRKVTPSNRP